MNSIKQIFKKFTTLDDVEPETTEQEDSTIESTTNYADDESSNDADAGEDSLATAEETSAPASSDDASTAEKKEKEHTHKGCCHKDHTEHKHDHKHECHSEGHGDKHDGEHKHSECHSDEHKHEEHDHKSEHSHDSHTHGGCCGCDCGEEHALEPREHLELAWAEAKEQMTEVSEQAAKRFAIIKDQGTQVLARVGAAVRERGINVRHLAATLAVLLAVLAMLVMLPTPTAHHADAHPAGCGCHHDEPAQVVTVDELLETLRKQAQIVQKFAQDVEPTEEVETIEQTQESEVEHVCELDGCEQENAEKAAPSDAEPKRAEQDTPIYAC